MFDPATITVMLAKLNALAGGLFLLTAFGLVATRQVFACLRIYVVQALLLAFSAILLGVLYGSVHLFIVAAITLAVKCVLIPRTLRRTVGQDIYARREISQTLNVPMSLLIAVAIAFVAYAVATPLLDHFHGPQRKHQPAHRHSGAFPWGLYRYRSARGYSPTHGYFGYGKRRLFRRRSDCSRLIAYRRTGRRFRCLDHRSGHGSPDQENL